MRAHRFVVFADWLKGFDTLEEARTFAQLNCPSVICERVATADGGSELQEIMRHDWLYDADRDEWRYLLASTALSS